MILPLRGLCGPQAPSPMAGMAGMPPKTGGEIWRSRPNILYLQPYRFPAAGSAGQGIKRETGENPVQFPLLYAPPPVGRNCWAAIFDHWSCGIGKVPPAGRVRRPAGTGPCAPGLRRTGGCETRFIPNAVSLCEICRPTGADAAAGLLYLHAALPHAGTRAVLWDMLTI